MPYFDAATTLPLHPLARQALLSALDEGWADPTRLYRDGRRARMLLDAARETLAAELGARTDEVSFTASGTLANHVGVLGALSGNHRKGRHFVHSAVEHSSVLHAAEQFERDGGEVTSVGVDALGRVGTGEFAAALRPDTALAALQSANHEVGTVQPVAEVAELCAEAGVPLLVDAAQSAAWGPVPGRWSLLTASAHKWGGPVGLGVLVVRKGTRYRSPLPADDRGFVDVPSAIAAAVALRAVRQEAASADAALRPLVARLRAELPGLVPDLAVLGDAERRLPHVLTFSCLYVDGEALLHELDRAGFAVSSGSSCSSSTLTPSHVLAAMGALTEGNVRVSLPTGTTAADIDAFLAALPRAVAGTRAHLEPAPASAPLVVDSIGKRCPVPIIELAKRFPTVPVGATVVVLSDDEAARLDVPAWCEMRTQRYVGEADATDYRADAPSGARAYLVERLS
ncbi:cysteine desulfurase/sulfurtransferase TusA family protein [Streptacidiphilus monticola]|uniref:Cysteine desulfurase/sulfurtransferase TusA family protein n=1 Tax=Streptacidiphilus monticola TaxID=2161674 RepID=A0ABW1G057_9ACTN